MSDAQDAAPYDGEIIHPATTTRSMVASNPFERSAPAGINAGAVSIESQRATAEVQGRMVVAKRFPRDGQAAYAAAMEACQRIGLAECAIYSYNKGGKVEGPSIRLAEELARSWGNIEYGLNELSRFDGGSEMEAFAWDLETNTRSSQKFTVKHIRDLSSGQGRALTQERDIYEITANMGARRMRARILAILPPELVDDAVAACKHTIKHGGGKPLADRIRAMTTAFSQVGVTAKMLTDKVGHALDQITPDELVTLRSDLQAIKEGTKVSEFFGAKLTANTAPANADPFEAAAAGKVADRQVGDPPVNLALETLIEAIDSAPNEAALLAISNDKANRKLVQGLTKEETARIKATTEAAYAGFKRPPAAAHDDDTFPGVVTPRADPAEVDRTVDGYGTNTRMAG